jgi:hypothetical protein
MRTAFKWTLLVVLPMLALLASAPPPAHATPRSTSLPLLLAGAAVMGTTTGTLSSGTDFIGMNDMLKNVYTDVFENNVEADEKSPISSTRPKASRSSTARR